MTSRQWDLLSGGTRSLWGHPDRLRWCGYRPVTWPVPSQPGVGHLLSFFSPLEESGKDREMRQREWAGGGVESTGNQRPSVGTVGCFLASNDQMWAGSISYMGARFGYHSFTCRIKNGRVIYFATLMKKGDWKRATSMDEIDAVVQVVVSQNYNS